MTVKTRKGETVVEHDEFIREGVEVASLAGLRAAFKKEGTVTSFMVGKRNGRVQYAVLSFGGLFGMGEKFYPLPWDTLTYDTDKGGYMVDIDKDRLEGAPSYDRGNEPTYDRAYGERVYGHYGLAY